VEIAKALSTESQVLLLDEPTSALTLAEADRLFEIVGRLRDQGKAILLVSHKLEEVFAICDTVTVLRDGVSVLEAAPLSEHSTDDVISLMVGRSHAAQRFAPRPALPDGPPALELDQVTTAPATATFHFRYAGARSSDCTDSSGPGAQNWPKRSSASIVWSPARSG
jgi:ABC-type sugar transport system, ATPase component